MTTVAEKVQRNERVSGEGQEDGDYWRSRQARTNGLAEQKQRDGMANETKHIISAK